VKPTRMLAAATVIAALALGGVFAAPVAAAPGDVYVAASDLAPTASPPQTGWSYAATAAPVSTAAGLAVAAGAELTLGLGTSAAGVDLVPFGAGVLVDEATDVAGVRFRIGLLTADTDPASYATLTADEPGVGSLADAGATWTGTFFPGSFTLAEIDALLDAEYPGHLIADVGFGAADAPFTTARFRAGGVGYVFTPVPTVSVTPPDPTPLAFGTTGVTATFTGLLPGAQVFAFFLPEGGDPDDAVLIEQDLVADAAGSVAVVYVAATTTTVAGGYSIVVGDGLDVFEAPFTVVAAAAPVAPAPGPNSPAATPSAPELAATGTDPAPGAVSAAVLLVLGLVLRFSGSRARRPVRA